MPKLKIKPSLKRKSSEWEIISDDTPMAQNGRITLDEFRPKFANSNESIQQNIKKQQEINKIKNQINFPLYKSNENTEELKAQIGDQSEVLKNIVWKDQIPEYIKNIKNHPENEKFWHKETLEKAKNYTNDTSRYLAAFQLLKENGNPYITQNPYFEDKYRKSINSKTSNFRDSKNLMYLEPNDREAFVAELSHAQQLKDNFIEDKNVIQKLDSIYKKEKQVNPKIDYHEVYDKYYYNMPNSIEYDAHTLRQPKLEERYHFLTDSFKNELPFMSFTPQYKVNEKIKLDNAGKDYYKGNIGNLRRIINKGVDNIFGTDIYKAFGNDPKKYKSGGKIKTDPQGYWNPKNKNEKALKIPSNNISMQNIDFPILGISDTNDIKMMYPNGEYQFQGNSVTEFPIMQQGGQVRQPIKGIKKTGKLLGTYKNGEKVSDWEIID